MVSTCTPHCLRAQMSHVHAMHMYILKPSAEIARVGMHLNDGIQEHSHHHDDGSTGGELVSSHSSSQKVNFPRQLFVHRLALQW